MAKKLEVDIIWPSDYGLTSEEIKNRYPSPYYLLRITVGNNVFINETPYFDMIEVKRERDRIARILGLKPIYLSDIRGSKKV